MPLPLLAVAGAAIGRVALGAAARGVATRAAGSAAAGSATGGAGAAAGGVGFGGIARQVGVSAGTHALMGGGGASNGHAADPSMSTAQVASVLNPAQFG